MITLYGFGAGFGLPDPSPFVMKTETQLKMSGLPYQKTQGELPNAPKGKLPYIDDDGTLVGDSTLIRAHLEARHGVDLDRHLAPEQRTVGWAVERMLEEHLYFALLHLRWADDANFASGPARFFDGVPEPARHGVQQQIRDKVRSGLVTQGMGRHTPAEIAALGGKSVDAAAALLGDKPYLFGAEPCGADATLFAFTAGALAPIFAGPLVDTARRHANLTAYRDRMMQRYYPEFR